MKSLVILLLITPFSLLSQEASELPPEDGPGLDFFISAPVGIPIDEFKEAVGDELSFGITFGGAGSVNSRRNLFIGTELTYLLFGKEKIPANTNEFRFKSTNNNWRWKAFLRITPPVNSVVTPYFDGIIGLSIFHTKTKIDDSFFDTVVLELPEEVIGTFNDVAFAYGGAAGLKIGNGPAKLDLRVAYLFGGRADYIRKGSVTIAGNDLFFESTESSTTMLVPQIGFSYSY